ncbi:S41 family peptidase [[Clostridium] polysaccharolyticum]|uniref:Carboxyl-terminal processing protease n=1 Tax=[Clostridium] polysaccharolyticum TaxID=29364 RepID=A0A1I0EPS2_9FIRM|nr:S41 family peptidase [[Clostridium] polysaccharolyticum]SET47266.1 carboxyl-terminal processing protease [[Clostridium] polysaccharolyticum]
MERKKFLSGFLCGIALTLCIGRFVTYGNQVGWFDKIYQISRGSENITNAQRRQALRKLGVLEKYIDKYYLNDLTAKDYEEGLYNGLVSSMQDRYAAYYNKEEYKEYNIDSIGKYVGIGCSVAFDQETGLFTILQPYKDGPADEAGMCTGDVLVSINGESVHGKTLADVVSMIKGREGSKVKVCVKRKSGKELVELDVRRKEVETRTVTYSMLEDNIGYIMIAGFKNTTVKQFNKAVDSLQKQKMKGLILDVRDNGGGALDAVVSITDRILSKGLIVYTKDKNGKGDKYYAKDKKKLDLPMVLLVNGNSASASEVLAGALKDHKLATLVGTKTFGKGIVQSVFSLYDGSAIKLTTSKYYTPDGNNIHDIGIEPDVVVEMNESYDPVEDDLTEGPDLEKDNQLLTAIKCLSEKLS